MGGIWGKSPLRGKRAATPGTWEAACLSNLRGTKSEMETLDQDFKLNHNTWLQERYIYTADAASPA